MGTLLNGAGYLLTKDTEKANLLNGFFASVFIGKVFLQESHVPETRGKVWNKKDLSLVEEAQGREHLNKLDTHKDMGPDGMHTQVVREMTDVIVRPLAIVFERSWGLGEVSEDWSKCHSYLQEGQEERARELQASQPHLDPEESGGANNSGNYFQTYQEQEGDEE